MSAPPTDTLPALGPVTQARLADAGIVTMGDLRSIGSVEAYRRLKFMLPRQLGFDALYALEAALRGCRALDLPEDVTAALRQQARSIDDAFRRGAAPRCAL